jgi:hypothetical protein
VRGDGALLSGDLNLPLVYLAEVPGGLQATPRERRQLPEEVEEVADARRHSMGVHAKLGPRHGMLSLDPEDGPPRYFLVHPPRPYLAPRKGGVAVVPPGPVHDHATLGQINEALDSIPTPPRAHPVDHFLPVVEVGPGASEDDVVSLLRDAPDEAHGEQPSGSSAESKVTRKETSPETLARPEGFEPPTFRSVAGRSNPLSYGRISLETTRGPIAGEFPRVVSGWRRRRDLNPGRGFTPLNALAVRSLRPLGHASPFASSMIATPGNVPR